MRIFIFAHGYFGLLIRLIIFYNKGGKKMDIFKDIWGFLKTRKKFWLLPIIIVLLLFGALIVLTSGTAIAPFIYTIF
jgi:hypothetical protein